MAPRGSRPDRREPGGGEGRGDGRGDNPALLGAYWEKALALLDDRERLLDTSDCVLPAPDKFFQSSAWELPEVISQRAALNEAKELLDELDNTDWDKYATIANYAEYVRRDLRKLYGVELATVAWAKMYEMIVRNDLLPQQSPALGPARGAGGGGGGGRGLGNERPCVTVHLCEAPGGFVAATNHFLRTHRPDWGWAWDWLAVSLNPYYSGNDQFAMVDDDAFMRATLSHWCFGADDSGDIRRPRNIRAVWAEVRRRCAAAGVPGAMLVTADGAIDTSMVPAAQELVNASLHFTEVVAALGMLAPGGCLVWKGFTLFEHTSLCTLHLVGCLFETVSVCKPCTSKPCNSEVYVVGRGFRGVSEEVLELLLAKCGEDVFDSGAMLPQELLPAGLVKSALAATSHFAACTAEAIRDALDKAGLPPNGPTSTAIRRAKEHFAAEWFARMRLLRLERRFFVAPHEAIDGTNNSTSNVLGRRRELLGTLQERQEQYRRRRNDLGLDGGAIATAAALAGQLGSSYGSVFGSGGGGGLVGRAGVISGSVGAYHSSGLGRLAGMYGGGADSLGTSPADSYYLGGRMGLGAGGPGSSPTRRGLRCGLPACGEAADDDAADDFGAVSIDGGALGLGLGFIAMPDEDACEVAQPARGGLGSRAAGADAAALGSSGMQVSDTIARLMVKMGYTEGAGLGRHGQGIAAAVPAVGNAGRVGLGASVGSYGGISSTADAPTAGLGAAGRSGLGGGSSANVVGLGWRGEVISSGEGDAGDGSANAAGSQLAPARAWQLAPDARMLENHLPLTSGELAAWAASTAAAATAVSVAQQSGCSSAATSSSRAWGGASLGRQAPPAKLTKSKYIIDDHVLVALRRLRETYNAAAFAAAAGAAAPPAASSTPATRAAAHSAGLQSGLLSSSKLCRHVGPWCVAPRRWGAGQMGRSYWKLASLDATLLVCKHAAEAAAQAGCEPQALDLSLHSAGATDYLLGGSGAASGGGSSAVGAGADHCGDEGDSPNSRRSAPDDGCSASGGDISVGGSESRSDSSDSEVRTQPRTGLGGARGDVKVTADDSNKLNASSGAAAADKEGGSTWPWTCTLLDTAAARDFAGRLAAEQGSRVRLQPLPALVAAVNNGASSPRPAADPLSLFTPDSVRALVQLVNNSGTLPTAAAVDGGSIAAALNTNGGASGNSSSRGVRSSAGGRGVHLVLGDLSSLRRTRCGWPASSQGPMEGEFDTLYRRRLLWEATVALGALCPGGCAVLRVGDCLTMFTASVLYLLHRSFSRLAIVKPFASCACSPERFAVGIGRIDDGGVVAAQMLAGLEAVIAVEAPPVQLPAAMPQGCMTGGPPVASSVASPQGVSAAARPPKGPCSGDCSPPGVCSATGMSKTELRPQPERSLRVQVCVASDGSGVGLVCTYPEASNSAPAGSRNSSPGRASMPSCGDAMQRGDGGKMGPMAVTGVAPLTVCVTGDFYVYLAARTQDLARRQIQACEAAVAAASPNPSMLSQPSVASVTAGLDSAATTVGPPSAEDSSTETDFRERHAVLARLAEASLVTAREAAERELREQACSAAGDGSDLDQALRRNYGGMFVRGGGAGGGGGGAGTAAGAGAGAAGGGRGGRGSGTTAFVGHHMAVRRNSTLQMVATAGLEVVAVGAARVGVRVTAAGSS
ncbi:hypothetical protein HYH02_014285 [Chlamydomonas schloesseri]|uniref:Cap-specific mRNA (nucleoside-2'-O-)-methyltransferase 2 n=1 Tax=Chlamydomonas schloesseri TaxID=2026947 RepID=A0A835SRX6_9CHLO|nr:hypothetical protein HYH02_014285 [Chlamydomonas schloesseri]|eukprot:KAG2428583.1 hypothetical protein HYH02_014285 [Chlamydomonas schloesseri]